MIKELFITLLPFVIISSVIICAFLIFAIIYPKRKKSELVAQRYHKSFVGVFMREFWYWFIHPLLKMFLLLGFNANAVTALSLVIAFISAYFFVIGNIVAGGFILLAGSSLDMIDGQIARLTNSVSLQGAFFDSCVDRYSEGVLFGSLIIYFALKTPCDVIGIVIAIIALMGSQMVSYSKARGEGVGYSTKKGLMQRPERIFIMVFFTTLHPFFGVILKNFGYAADYTLYFALGFIAVFTNITAVSRTVDIFRAVGELKDKNE